MGKNIIKLTESDLKYMILESVNRLLTESQESKSQDKAKKVCRICRPFFRI